MGNRAVIVSADTTAENANERIGLYVHWYGSEDSVKEALTKAKELHIRSVDSDDLYFWARFCQVFANIITDDSKNWNKEPDYSTGIGIGVVSQLDCHNYDNGVYYIDGKFEIVKHTDGSELEQKVQKQLWQVTQTQRSEIYDHTPIYTTESYDEAVKCARMLNKQFGRGCIFTPEGDYEYEVADSEYVHFYKVAGCKLGIDLEDVLFEEPETGWVVEVFKNEMHCGWLADDKDISITQSYDDAKVFDDYAEAVKFTRENGEANDVEYCVCPAE